MVYKNPHVLKFVMISLFVVNLMPIYTIGLSENDSTALADFILVPERPENLAYFEPGYLTAMEIDTRTNIGYFGCLNGVLIKNLSTGDYKFISRYEGLSNPKVELLELDQVNSRLFIKVYGSFKVYELDIRTDEISKMYQFDAKDTMVKASEFRAIQYEPEKNVLYIGSSAGLTELFLTSGVFNFYDILFFDLNFSKYENVNNSLEIETSDLFSIESFDYNANTKDLYVATSIGLTIFNTEFKTLINFRSGSILAGKIRCMDFIEGSLELFLGGDFLIRYNTQTEKTYIYRSVNFEPITALTYDAEHKLIYASHNNHDIIQYDPFEVNDTSSNESDREERIIMSISLFPFIQYNDFSGLLFMGLGESRRLECKWKITYDLTTIDSKKKIRDLDSFISKPNKIAQFVELKDGGTGSSSNTLYTIIAYDHDSHTLHNITLTDIQLNAEQIYSLKIHPGTGYVFLSAPNHFSIFDHDTSLLKQIYTTNYTGTGFNYNNYYDFEFNDNFAYISTASGIKVMNISTLETNDFKINGSTIKGSIEFGKKTGKMYIAYNKNITIYNLLTGDTEMIFVNASTSKLTIDKNEEIAFVGNWYQVHKIYLKNKTVQLFREDHCLIDIDYHINSDTFIFRYTNSKFITANDGLLDSLPETASISSMYIDQENDVLYLLTGIEWCEGGGSGSSDQGALRGLIIYDMNSKLWVNYTVFYKLPLGGKSGIAYDATRDTIHFVGEYSIISMNESVISSNPIGKHIQTIEISPVESEELKTGKILLPVIYFGVVGVGIIILAGFLIILEPTKYKLAASFTSPFYTRLKKDKVLDHNTRGRISGMIDIEPGINYNELKNRLKLNNGTLSYHLKVLEREEQVKSKNSGKYKYFFLAEVAIPKKIFKMNDVQKLIFKKINEMPGISQKEIADEIGSSTSTVNYNIKIMIEKGIVNVDKERNETRCYIVTDEGRIEKS